MSKAAFLLTGWALLAGLPAWGGAPPGVEEGGRRFSVDLMVKSEDLREVGFSPRGDRLLLERLLPYEASADFGWYMFGRERATVLEVALGEKITVTPLSSNPNERLWITTYSPSGAKAALGWFDGSMVRVAVYHVDSGQLQKLDLPGSVSILDSYRSPFWLSDDEFVLFSQPLQAQRRMGKPVSDWQERRFELARQSWAGEQAAVTVFGSGRYWIEQGPVYNAGTLLRVDLRTGRSTELGSGYYYQFSLSPDRKRLAAVRHAGSLDLGNTRASTLHGMDKHAELIVYDFTRARPEVMPCRSCNITLESLRWSPSGNKLFFAARVSRDGSFAHEYYIYDFRRASLKRFVPRDMDIAASGEWLQNYFVVPVVWLTDDALAVRVRKAMSPAASGSAAQRSAYDWFAVREGRTAIPLTTGLAASQTATLENIVAVRNGRLFIMADGDLWEIAPDGTRKNLTASIDESLTPWCAKVVLYGRSRGHAECTGVTPSLKVRPLDANALAEGWLTLEINKDGVGTGDLLFVNVDSAQTVRVERPHPDAVLVNASALAQAAVYYHLGSDGDRVLLASAQGATHELLHLNRHLADVMSSKLVLLTRREPGETRDRYDWLLLPPDYQPGRRYPLLVQFYPDHSFTKEWTGSDLRSVDHLNPHLATAKGYAVLMPSMYLPTASDAVNPMTDLHEQLIRAAENAVKAGYADPERWAINGQSYGGYGTNSVVTQTDRFKAAVAVVGPSNLTSMYANGLHGALELSEKAGFGAQWAEGGQGRMGTTPWENPMRYVVNSPLFHADRIRTPLMLIHGDADRAVPVGESEQLFNALLRLGKDAVFVRYWGEGHVIQSPANIRDMWDRIIAWLDEHLGVQRDAEGRILN